jgi:hypothetical protein
MSEWGNPLTVMGKYSSLNKIGLVEGTPGTETSQYRVGKESNSDTLSSGERNGLSLNRAGVIA